MNIFLYFYNSSVFFYCFEHRPGRRGPGPAGRRRFFADQPRFKFASLLRSSGATINAFTPHSGSSLAVHRHGVALRQPLSAPAPRGVQRLQRWCFLLAGSRAGAGRLEREDFTLGKRSRLWVFDVGGRENKVGDCLGE